MLIKRSVDMRKRLGVGSLLILMLIALPSCGDSSSPTEPPPPPPPPSNEPDAPMEPPSEPNPSPEGGQVTIYERDNFGGQGRTLFSSVDRLSNLPGPCNVSNNWEDCISSIQVSPGWSAFLYEGANFNGDALPVTGDILNLDNIPGCGALGDWDNCASSIQVFPPNSAARVATGGQRP